jgi:cephalosporin hydroxylase
MKEAIKNLFREIKDVYQLSRLSPKKVVTENLIYLENTQKVLYDIFSSSTFVNAWENVAPELKHLSLPENTGGVNSGDQRAIAYLVWHFKPLRILEIGTHIGCSTVHLAIAHRELNLDINSSKIITVDIKDVNDSIERPWLSYSSKFSPIELVNKINYTGVEFVSSPSIDYLNGSNEIFDFIFLDGGHSAKLVYNELPLASRLLAPNGVILLHDYFPLNKPIWDDRSVIPGPYLATQRLINEGNKIKITPLGNLPWPTKKGTNLTSLAICTLSI